jgi:2-keto-4-pentenoate hydratase/2-oxohepta-3-ene-1,7-dioic acid hydratase in catechol pathway
MKLVTFRSGRGEHVGALSGDRLVDLTDAGVAGTMLDLIRAGKAGLRRARQAVRAANGSGKKLAGAKLLPPLRPGKVLCCGINYASHADENPNARMPSEPFFFAKLPSSIAGPEDAIEVPAMSQQVDYEVEFSAVIGKRLSRASQDEVMPALFGYTLLNDVSARDVQFKDSQITIGKNFNRFAPIGPCIVTCDELATPGAVRLTTRLNGATMQDGNTSEWLFPLPRLISFLSQVMALEPGDLVTTGTPAGVGFFRKPQVFMKAGDVIEIEAEGIGVLRNPIVGSP